MKSFELAPFCKLSGDAILLRLHSYCGGTTGISLGGAVGSIEPLWVRSLVQTSNRLRPEARRSLLRVTFVCRRLRRISFEITLVIFNTAEVSKMLPTTKSWIEVGGEGELSKEGYFPESGRTLFGRLSKRAHRRSGKK